MTTHGPSAGADATGSFVLRVSPDPESVALARLFAGSVGRRAGCPEDAIEDIKLAISEALTNAVKAHELAATREPVRIVARVDGPTLVFEVVDAGAGFDVGDERASNEATPAPGLYAGSLGLTVIRTLFPKVQIERNRERGMTVRFETERETADA